VFNDKATTKAYDKAMLITLKQHQSTTQSNDQSNTTIDKLITNKEELTKIDKNEIFSFKLLETETWLNLFTNKINGFQMKSLRKEFCIGC
jgi:hypothetical protein